jgi:hypothetical protein
LADLAVGATPLNDTNLDVMDTALDSQNSRITTMEAQRGASFGSGGRELYVATSVSDANSGTSWAQAKATIQAAAAALNGPGTSMWARGVTRAQWTSARSTDAGS